MVEKWHILPHTTAHLVPPCVPACTGSGGAITGDSLKATWIFLFIYFFCSGRQSPEFKSSGDACAASLERTNLQMGVMKR